MNFDRTKQRELVEQVRTNQENLSMTIPEACKAAGISVNQYYTWRSSLKTKAKGKNKPLAKAAGTTRAKPEVLIRRGNQTTFLAMGNPRQLAEILIELNERVN